MMPGRIRSFFSRIRASDADRRERLFRPKPSWPEIVELMYDESASGFLDKVVQAVYSPDHERRLVITRNHRGLYEYVIQRIEETADSDWAFTSRDPDALPAIWIGISDTGRHLFATEREAWEDAVSTPEYRSYF